MKKYFENLKEPIKEYFDKVAEMKSKYESNDYQVDTGDFASKLLEKYQMGL